MKIYLCTPTDVARYLGVSRRSILAWIQGYDDTPNPIKVSKESFYTYRYWTAAQITEGWTAWLKKRKHDIYERNFPEEKG